MAEDDPPRALYQTMSDGALRLLLDAFILDRAAAGAFADSRIAAIRDELASRELARRLTPPWTDAQVAALNAWQHRRDVHPFTCGNDSTHRVLVARPDGWVCDDCDYRQGWAHPFMADTP